MRDSTLTSVYFLKYQLFHIVLIFVYNKNNKKLIKRAKAVAKHLQTKQILQSHGT